MPTRDESRFVDLYQCHGSAVWLYCRRRVGIDTADDAMSDVFLAVWRHIGDSPNPDEALPWLYRIAYLTVSNHWRSSGRGRRLQRKVDSLGVVPPTPIADQVVVREEVRVVVSLLHDLPKGDAEILRLVAWEQLNTEQIASVLNVTPDTAKQRLSRARKRLATMYERTTVNPLGSTPAASKGGEW